MKVSFKEKIIKRIAEKLRLSEYGIENAGPNASTFWQGYKQALEEIKTIVQ